MRVGSSLSPSPARALLGGLAWPLPAPPFLAAPTDLPSQGPISGTMHGACGLLHCAALRCAALQGTVHASEAPAVSPRPTSTTRGCTGNAWPSGSGWGPPAPLLLEEKTEGRGRRARRGRRPDPPAVARNWDWPRWRQVPRPLTLWPAVAVLWCWLRHPNRQPTCSWVGNGDGDGNGRPRLQRSLVLSCHAAYPARLPLFQGTKQCSCVGGLDEGATDGPPIAAGQAALAPHVFCFPPRGRPSWEVWPCSGRNLNHRIPRAPVHSACSASSTGHGTPYCIADQHQRPPRPGLVGPSRGASPTPKDPPCWAVSGVPTPSIFHLQTGTSSQSPWGSPTWGSAGQSFRRLPEGGWPSQASEPQPSRTFPLWTDVGTESETAYPNPPAAFSSPTCHRTHVTLAAEEADAAWPLPGARRPNLLCHSTWIPGESPGALFSGHLPETCGTSGLCTKIEDTDGPDDITTHTYRHTNTHTRTARPSAQAVPDGRFGG